MDKTAFFTMTSGLYVVSAAAGDRKAGCVVNTAVQVTSSPARISVAVNKENFTAGVIADAGAFAVTVIDRTADMIYIGNFGFRTSANFDKFERYEERQTALGAPYVPEHATALFSCRRRNSFVRCHERGKGEPQTENPSRISGEENQAEMVI